MKSIMSEFLKLHRSRRALWSTALVAIVSFAAVGQLSGVIINWRMFGIATGQTARINLVNIGDPNLSTASCRAEFKFVDSSGRVLKDSGIQDLLPGQAMFFDLDRREILSSTATPTANRVQIRAVGDVRVSNTSIIPPGPCRSSLEVVDNLTGRTTIWLFDDPGE